MSIVQLVEQRIVAPEVAGSIPSIYPIIFFYVYNTYNLINTGTERLKSFLINCLLFQTNFLIRYYFLNEMLWQEGLLTDFIQKKTINNWVIKFLNYSSYILSERLLFDKIIKFYLDLLVWPLQKSFIFELGNVNSLLWFIVSFFILFYILFFLSFFLMF